MNSMKLLILLIVAFSAGCASTDEKFNQPAPRAADIFTIYLPGESGVPMIYQPSAADLKEFRSKWTLGSEKIANTSKLKSDDRQWVMDYISISTMPYNCTSMSLEKIDTKPLGKIQDGFGAKNAPALYSEIWSISDCAGHADFYIHDENFNLAVGSKIRKL